MRGAPPPALRLAHARRAGAQLALSLKNLGNWEAAEKRYTRTLKINPQSVYIRIRLASLMLNDARPPRPLKTIKWATQAMLRGAIDDGDTLLQAVHTK